MARRLLAMFDGNAKLIKNYIKWVFHFKVKNTNYQVTSLGFFVSEKFLQEYNHAKARASVLRRSTLLPKNYISWCQENAKEIFEIRDFSTWNDLNGCISYLNNRGKNETIKKVLIKAVEFNMIKDINEYRKLED